MFFFKLPFPFLHNSAPSSTFKNDAFCLLIYLQRDAAKAEPAIKLLSAMRFLVVTAYVVIIMFDPKRDRIRYFIMSFIVVLAVYLQRIQIFKSR